MAVPLIPYATFLLLDLKNHRAWQCEISSRFQSIQPLIQHANLVVVQHPVQRAQVLRHLLNRLRSRDWHRACRRARFVRETWIIGSRAVLDLLEFHSLHAIRSVFLRCTLAALPAADCSFLGTLNVVKARTCEHANGCQAAQRCCATHQWPREMHAGAPLALR